MACDQLNEETLPNSLLTIFCLSSLSSACCINIQTESKGFLTPTSEPVRSRPLSEIMTLAEKTKNEDKDKGRRTKAKEIYEKVISTL